MKWEMQNLSSLGEFKNGVNFSSDKIGKGHPLINVKDITDYKFLRTEHLQRVNLDLNSESDYFSREGDIFFVRSSVKREGAGAAGVLVSLPEPTIHCGFVIRYRPTSNNILSKFLLYYLHSPATRDELRNLASGATIYNISQGGLKQLRIPLPPLDIQQRITGILSAYDDLIENNLRRIQLLEEAARCRYKLIRASTPLNKQRIKDIGEVVTGKTPSTFSQVFFGGNILFVKTPDMHGNVFVIDTEQKLTEIGANSQTKKFVPPNSIMVTCIGVNVGIVSLTNQTCQTNQQINTIIPFTANLSFYLLFAMKEKKAELQALGSTGATMPNVNKSKFENIEVDLPNESELKRFQEECEPMFELLKVLSLQNIQLKQARDILLPRLMSGEIDVTSVIVPRIESLEIV